MFGVSRQAYYRSKWSYKKQNDIATAVLSLVMDVRQTMPRIGTRKLYYILSEPLSQLGVGRDKLFSILNANHMCIKPKRSYHVTTNSHHRFHKHKNLILDMEITKPEQVWVSDITYIGSRTNHSYLALITDAYSKKIVGYNFSSSLSADSSIKALNMAIKNRKYKNRSLIHHSDKGIQYCCNEYQKILNNYKISCSMTESYDPYQNAIAERVNGILKDEFSLEKYKVDYNTMSDLITNSIYIYNTMRPHFSCNMLTPEQMHKQNNMRIKTYKKTDSCKTMHATIC